MNYVNKNNNNERKRSKEVEETKKTDLYFIDFAYVYVCVNTLISYINIIFAGCRFSEAKDTFHKVQKISLLLLLLVDQNICTIYCVVLLCV